jgi:hypothetical protein
MKNDKHHALAYEEAQRVPDDDSYMINKMLNCMSERWIIEELLNKENSTWNT